MHDPEFFGFYDGKQTKLSYYGNSSGIYTGLEGLVSRFLAWIRTRANNAGAVHVCLTSIADAWIKPFAPHRSSFTNDSLLVLNNWLHQHSTIPTIYGIAGRVRNRPLCRRDLIDIGFYGLTEHCPYYFIDESYLRDSTRCGQGGVIYNLEDACLELWQSNQTEPDLSNRYGWLMREWGYYPCRLIWKRPLTQLLSTPFNDVMEEIVRQCHN